MVGFGCGDSLVSKNGGSLQIAQSASALRALSAKYFFEGLFNWVTGKHFDGFFRSLCTGSSVLPTSSNDF